MKQHSSSPGTGPGSLHPVPGPPWEFCAVISLPQIRRQGLRWGKRPARKPQLRILMTVGIPPKPCVVSPAVCCKGSGPWWGEAPEKGARVVQQTHRGILGHSCCMGAGRTRFLLCFPAQETLPSGYEAPGRGCRCKRRQLPGAGACTHGLGHRVPPLEAVPWCIGSAALTVVRPWSLIMRRTAAHCRRLLLYPRTLTLPSL